MPKIIDSLRAPSLRIEKGFLNSNFYYSGRIGEEAPFNAWLRLMRIWNGEHSEIIASDFLKFNKKERCWIRRYESGVILVEYSDSTNMIDQKHQLLIYGWNWSKFPESMKTDIRRYLRYAKVSALENR